MSSVTESYHKKTTNLDLLSIDEILSVMIEEDRTLPIAIEKIKNDIQNCVRLMVNSIRAGGKIIYIGAGTSGRLGVLDAVECVPTFSSPPSLFQGFIAGGRDAMFSSAEGAEDNPKFGIDIVEKHAVKQDVVIGIASSGITPFVFGGLDQAKAIGAKTALITCNKFEKKAEYDVIIELIVGPEILSGSTRLKSGTATKMVLNMLSTTTMVQLGKVYKNLMVDLKITNQKLYRRAVRIFCEICKSNESTAKLYLKKSTMNLKIAIVMKMENLSCEDAAFALERANGNLRGVL